MMKNIKKILALSMVFCLTGVLCGCDQKLSYKENNNDVSTRQASKESDLQQDQKNVDAVEETFEPKVSKTETGKLETGKFLKAKERHYKKGVKRTFYVWLNETKLSGKESSKYRKQIAELPEVEKSQEIYSCPNGKIKVKEERLNPQYVQYLRDHSPDLYKQMEKDGYYEVPFILYTYPSCGETALSQTCVSKNMGDGSYRGGAVTDFGKGEKLDLSIDWQLEPTKKTTKYEAVLEKQTMDVKWFSDENVMSVRLSVPYDQFFKLVPNVKKEFPTRFVVKSKKEKEKELRKRITSLLEEKGIIYESSFYE